MKQKKIAVIYVITKLELGGAQKVCTTLFDHLKEKPHIQTFLITSKGKLTELRAPDETTFYIDSFAREVGIRTIWYDIKTFILMIRHIRSIKKSFDHAIVHTHSTKAGILGRWAAFLAGVQRIHTIHGYAFHDHQSWLVWLMIVATEWLTSLITHHFICVSSYDAQQGKKLFIGFEKKHSIIRAAVAWEQFYLPAVRTTLPPSESFIFGTVACFKPQKNLFDLLKAFELVYQHNPQTRLELIGDGELRPLITAWIRQHNLEHVITLHGWQNDVASFMMNWHAFVLSSLWEGLPCAIIEARLLKLPVLSYNTGGIYDVIYSGKNGFLYEQKNWSALAQGMLAISNNKQLHERLTQYNDQLADFHYTAMVDAHYQLYSTLSQHKI